jgi:rhodanese-related sulfurtransferase/soluble cytochrome b562
MKKLIVAVLFLGMCIPVHAGDTGLETYITGFDYAARKEMKIDSKELIDLLEEGRAQLIDIRFSEEYEAWRVGPSISIPLNELPARLDEIDKTKIVVTACPHKDRATIAMVYLRSRGIPAKYLADGLIGLAENLRGDNAKYFIQSINRPAAKASIPDQLVSQMAELDQVIIPAAANSNQGSTEKTKTAVLRLQSQWSLFLTSAKDAFPGDQGWRLGLDKINAHIAEVVKATEKGDLLKVHEILEDVRNTFETLREAHHITYYLDGFSRYRSVLEKTAAPLAGKTASELSDSDLEVIASMVPDLKSAWISVQSAPLDADLFHFDKAKIAEVRSAMEIVQKNIARLASVSPGGTRDQIFEAVSLLKPSLKKAFLMFGRF